jgi:hypothetical protein
VLAPPSPTLEESALERADVGGELDLHVQTVHLRQLLDWMFGVCEDLWLQDATYALSARLLGRVLSARKTPLARLQLTGAVCLLLAAKIVEPAPPPLSQLTTDFSGGVFTSPQVVEEEVVILRLLEWRCQLPDPLSFLVRLQPSASGRRAFERARYLCFVATMCPECIGARAVLVARACLEAAERSVKGQSLAAGETDTAALRAALELAALDGGAQFPDLALAFAPIHGDMFGT